MRGRGPERRGGRRRRVSASLPDVLPAALAAAATAEVAWLEDGLPRAGTVVPLVDGAVPVLALPYAYAAWARSLGTRQAVVLSLTDPRQCSGGWRPVAVTARPRPVAALDGEDFTERLLDQELRKHPPSRSLADSALLRREHWWYLPRLVVRLDVLDVRELPARRGRDDALLVTAGEGTAPGGVAGRPGVGCVRVGAWRRPLPLEDLAGGRPAPDSDEALLLGHDFTEPDLERWSTWTVAGRLRGGGLEADPPARPPVRMPGLLERLRRHRELRRACLRGIAEAAAVSGGGRPRVREDPPPRG